MLPHLLSGIVGKQSIQLLNLQNWAACPLALGSDEMNQDSQGKPTGLNSVNVKNRNKCLLILFFISAFLATDSIEISDIANQGRYSSSTAYYFGGIIGALIWIYLFSLFFFAIVRSIRGGSAPFAGLGTGIAAALLLFGITTHEDARVIDKSFEATHVEDAGSSQR